MKQMSRVVLCAVLGVAVVSPASGLALSFDTVIDSNTPLSTGDVFASPNAVVSGPGGSVATISLLDTGDTSVSFNLLPGSAQTEVVLVADGSTSFYTDPASGFTSTAPLSVSGNTPASLSISDNNRLTFTAVGPGIVNPPFAILQYDPSPLSPGVSGTEHRVVVEGDALFGSPFILDPDGNRTDLSVHVNAAGQVAFAGAQSGVISLARGNGSGVGSRTLLGSEAGPISDSRVGEFDRVMTDPSGDAVFIATLGSTENVVVDVGTGGYAYRAIFGSTGLTLGSTDWLPLNVYGVSDTHTLILAEDAADPTRMGWIYQSPGDTYTLAGQYVSFAPATGVMGDSSKAAFYTPDFFAGNSLLYVDPASLTPVTVAQEGDATLSGAIITSLDPEGSAVPALNDAGQLVFPATIDITGAGDLVNAWLYWLPGMAAPDVLIKEGDIVEIGGIAGRQIDSLYLDLLGPLGDLRKDGLSDDGFFAFAADYTGTLGTDDGVFGTAVLRTAVPAIPEPSSAALLGAVGILALRRRR